MNLLASYLFLVNLMLSLWAGGPAGLAATTSAARHGAKVLLVELCGLLGGIGTKGGVTNFEGLYGRQKGEMRQVVCGVVWLMICWSAWQPWAV